MCLVELLVAATLTTNPLPDPDVGYCDFVEHNTVVRFDKKRGEHSVTLDQVVAFEDGFAVDWIYYSQLVTVYQLSENRYMLVFKSGRFVICKRLYNSVTEYDLEYYNKGMPQQVFAKWPSQNQ
jgi:hypothetical protein